MGISRASEIVRRSCSSAGGLALPVVAGILSWMVCGDVVDVASAVFSVPIDVNLGHSLSLIVAVPAGQLLGAEMCISVLVLNIAVSK